MEKEKNKDINNELTFKNVTEGYMKLAYLINDDIARRYEELTSFRTGRDFNSEIRKYVANFVDSYKKYMTPENEAAMNKRLVEYNKLVVDLKTKILQSTTIPSMMISGSGNYPTAKKEKEMERTHEIERELYSDDGKHAKFLNNTEKMFNPIFIKIKAEKKLKQEKKAKENNWNDCKFKVKHDEIESYGIDRNDNRVYLTTLDKPSEETRKMFKKSGLRWSPKNKRWQRVLTENAINSLTRLFENFDLEVKL